MPETAMHGASAEALVEEIASLVGERSVATAESCTAGRIASRLACAEGAVEFLRGGVVAYQEQTKRSLLNVVADEVVSPGAAAQLALGAAALFGADIAVSSTGLAGPDPVDGVPGRTVFIATLVDGHLAGFEEHFEGSPEEVCEQATVRALLHLRSELAVKS